jgi:UDP-N-acetylmuramoylalanine--D-glutamate ligase
MVLKNKKVLIVGLGKTGVAAARFLKQKGALVTATDIRPDAEIAEAGELRSLGINIEAGGHRVESFLDTDLIVVSPGVPPDIEPLQRAGDKGISIISEVELACDEIKEPIVGITGTNGKTTTTALIGEVFSKAGIDVFVGGNIGRPLIGYSGGARYVVAELSSFQLEGISKFRPFIAVMLSISEDHLDRYPDLDSYKSAKERIFKNQKRSDYAILNLDDPIVRDMKGKTKARIYWFSSIEKPRRGVFLDGLLEQRRGPVDVPLDVRTVEEPQGVRVVGPRLPLGRGGLLGTCRRPRRRPARGSTKSSRLRVPPSCS